MRSFISLVVTFSMLSSGFANANIIGKNGEVFFRYDTGQERATEVPPPSHQTSDITAHFVGVVGFPFSEKIPLVPGKTITSWSLISGSIPRGLSFDPSTGIVSGNPETPVRGAEALAQGYDAAGAKAAIAEISIDTFKPNNQYRQVDFYAHTNHYQFQQLPVPDGMTVDHWNIIFTPPPGVDVVGRNYDGTPTAPGRYPIAAQGFDFLDREQLLLTGYYTVEDGPTFAAISDDVRPVPQIPGYQSFNDSPPSVRSVGGGAMRYTVEVKAGDVLPGSVNAEVVQPKGVRLFGNVAQPYQTASVRYKAVDTDGTIGYSNWWKIGTSNPQPDFNATTLGPFDLTVGTYVEIPFGTRGTTGAKNFTVASGTLPAGLTLDAVNGVIRGTPTTVETQTGISLHLDVTNNGNVDATNSVPFTIRVFPKAVGLAIADANPNPVNVRVNAPFTATVMPTGDIIEPYTLSVDASTLPAGMTFDPSTGAVGGSIPLAGRYSTVFHLVNGDGRTADATLRVGVYNPLTINPVSDITVAQYDVKTPLESFSYDAQGVMPSTDGASVPEISLIGSFPPGISLDAVNDAISGGTTKPPGAYGPFALQIRDGSGDTATTNPFSIAVTPRAALSVTISPVVEVHYRLQASVNPVVSLVRPPLSTALNLVYSLDGTLPDGLSFDPATGVISGKPSRTGTFPNLVLHVQDGDGPAYRATSEPFEIDVTPAGPLTAQAVPAVTTAIDTPVVIPAPSFVNVVGELTFVSASPLPAGLRFDIPTGTISGSPTELVSAQDVSIVATDEAGRTATASLSLTVLPLPTADLGALGTDWTMARFETKSFQVNASNLIGAPSYAMTGTLPTGLSLNSSTGVISGTASTEGVSSGLSVRVTDAATGLSAVTPDFSITVGPRQPLAIGYVTTVVYANSPAGMPMRPTTQNVHGAVAYSLASGTLPDGLALQPDTGFVVGQATTPGDYAFAVTGVDTDNSQSTANVALRVSLFGNISGPEQIDAGTWRVDEHFASAPIVYSNAIPPVGFFVDEAMPNGLILNPADGSISGTISSAGDYMFAVHGLDAQDRGANATVAASIKDALVVDAQPQSVTTTQYASTPISIAPTFANAIGSMTYAMAGDLPSGVSFDQSTGVISGKPGGKGTFANITITATDSHDGTHATSLPFTITVGDRDALTASLPSRAITLANHDITDIASVRVTNASYGDAVTYSYTGTLPAGVSFDADTGTFHGTATELGDFPSIFVMVSDSVGAKATAGPLTIHSQTDGDPITLSMADVVTKVGFAFTTPEPVVGNSVGTPHFYTEDSIPQIRLNATTGQLSGLFATVQDLNYDVFVSDQTDRATSERLAILVTPVLRIVAPTIVSVTQGTAANQTVDVSYAAGAVVYSKGAGNWPAGVSVDPSTGAVVGTPTAATGTYPGLTISGTDTFGGDTTGNANVDTQQSNVFSIRVNPTTATPRIANVSGNKLIFGTVGVAATPFAPTVTDSAAGKPWIYEGTTYTLNHNLAADTGLSFDPSTGVISGTPTSAIIYRDLTITVTSQLGDSSTTAPFWFGVAPKDAIAPTAGQVTKYYNRIDKGYSSNPLLWDNLIGNKTYTPPSGITSTFDYATGVFSDGPEGPNVLAGQPAGGWPNTTTVKDEFGRTGSITQYYFNMSPLAITVPSSTVAVVIGAAVTNTNVPTVTGRYGTLSYTATGLPAGLQVSPTTGSIFGTIAAGYSGPASVSVTVTVTDTYEVSATTATVSYTLTVSTGPITAKSGQQTAYNTRLGAAFSTSAPLFDNTVGAVTYASSALTSGGTFNSATGVITGPYTGSGTNTVTITATDSTGRTGTLVVVVNINPALTLVVSSPTTTLTMGQSYTNINTPTATSVVGTASYTATSLPAGMTISPTTGAISGTVPSSYAGGTTFPVAVTVTDSFDGSTKTAGYTLTALSGPITATAGQQTAYKTRLGAAFSTSAPLFDNTVGGVTYTSSALAPGGSFNGATGVVSGPYTVTGTNTITITARDSTGRTGTFTVAVTISSAMTVTVSSPTTSLGVGTTYTSINTPTTTNVLGVATYAATGLPAGFTMNANGSISGKLALGTPVGQTYPVIITVTDSYDGSSKSTSYTLTSAAGVLQVAAGQKTYYAVRVDRAWATDPIVVYNGVGTVSFAKYPGQGGNINASTGSYYQTGPQNGSAVITGQPAGGWLNTAVISDSRGSINFNAYIESLWGLATSIPTTMLAPRIGVTYTNINVPSTATLYGTASYVVSGLPTGMSFNAATGSISGTIPASVAAGSTFPITVTVTDSRDGATASTSYTLTATP